LKKVLIFLTIFANLILSANELKVNACGVVRGAFVKDLAKAFSKRYKIKVILNKKGGDRDVISALHSHSADLGFGCRELLNIKSEKGLKSEHIAWGVLAFIINPKNGVDSITTKQAKDILLGKIKNWKELGGVDAPINIYLRKPGVLSGVGYSLRKIIFKNLRVKLAKNAHIVANSDEIREAVSKDINAFAVGDGTSALAHGGVKLLRVNGVKPSKKALESKKYKAAREYFIYMPKTLTPEAKKFISFALSKEGQNVIKNSFAASLSEGSRMLKLLSESAKFENFTNDNSVGMDSLIENGKKGKLTIYGCGITRVAFLQELIKEFSKKFGIKIDTNSAGGDIFVLNKLYSKEADISFVCRKPFNEGKEKELWYAQVAWGALSFIVNPKNSIDNLTSKQVKDILLGKITNWKELGGADAPIHLYLRDSDKSGVGASAREILFKDRHFKLDKYTALAKNSGSIRKVVAKDPYGFAIDDVTSSQRVKSVKILNIDGVAPTKRAIIEGDYKYRKPLYVCLTQKPSNLSKKFVNFILSDEGQKIISLQHTANLEEGKDIDSQNNFIIQKLKFRLQGHIKK